MDKIYRETLNSCRSFLTENIQYDNLADELLKFNVLSRLTLETINDLASRREKVRKLLDSLPRRNNECFPLFLKCLDSSDQKHIADKLRQILQQQQQQQQQQQPNRDLYIPSSSQGNNNLCPVLAVGPPIPPLLPLTERESAIPSQPQKPIGSQSFCPVPKFNKNSSKISLMCSEESRLEHGGHGGAGGVVVDPSLSVDVDPHIEKNKLRLQRDNCYKMDSKPIGFLFIINNKDFLRSKPRGGSSKDMDDLDQLFVSFGFKSFTHENLKASEMKKELEDFSKLEDHKSVCCCVVVLMSHGDEKHVCGCDDEKITFDEIIYLFSDQNCPNLKDKPKLFIIQTCRDNLVSMAQETTGNSSNGRSSPSSNKSFSVNTTNISPTDNTTKSPCLSRKTDNTKPININNPTNSKNRTGLTNPTSITNSTDNSMKSFRRTPYIQPMEITSPTNNRSTSSTNPNSTSHTENLTNSTISTNIPEEVELSIKFLSIDFNHLSLDALPPLKKNKPPEVLSRADMLIAYSTAIGNKSYRCPKNGSIFIQTIIETFKEKAKSTSVTDMLIEVNGILRNKYLACEQISVPEVALTKKWFLFNPVSHS